MKTKSFRAIIIIFLLATIGYLMFDRRATEQTLGSVNVTHEYQATTTAEMSGALIKTAEFNQLISSSSAGVVLGSVVVASTTDAAIDFHDATSTNAVLDGTYSVPITTFPSSTPQNTYVFDVALTQGLVVQMQAGFEGDYVITWRR